jgi:hypothetical protein
LFYFLFREDEIMAQLINNPAVKVNVDDYRDMMFVMVAIPVVEEDVEHCCSASASWASASASPASRRS